MLLLLASSASPRFEAEFTQGLRDQTISAEIEEGLVAQRRSLGITTGVRLRAETETSRFGVDMTGAADWLTWTKGVRPERYGGVRALLGIRGPGPLTEATAHLRLGMEAKDLASLADETHSPFHMVTLGGEARRYTSTSVQEIQLDGFLGEGAWGARLRGRIGAPVSRGWFLTLGASTSRFGRVPGSERSELRQTTYQVEASALYVLPRGPQKKLR